MQCFQKDPNLRVSARKLLKHPWIVNAKRSDSVVRTPTTKYDEAVKSVQQWNAALQSPNAPRATRRISEITSPRPRRYNLEHSSVMNSAGKNQLGLARSRNAGAFLSPESTSQYISRHRSGDLTTNISIVEDNWDDDFASIISPAALQLPRNKASENSNLAGVQSFHRLKSFASNDGTDENWGDDFEGDITAKSPPPSE